MILAGDVGGTKTDLAVFSPERGLRAPLAQERFASDEYPSLEAIAGQFLAKAGLPVRHARIAVAGPVVDGRARLTNLPWVLDEAVLRTTLHLDSVRLLNDLEAIATAIPVLGPSDLHTLRAGTPVPGGTIAVIAPGTGLGEAFLTWDGSRYRAYASEGGHADFAPTSPLQIELLRSLQERFDHVSYERVCSGIGIPVVYEFLRGGGQPAESPTLRAQLDAAEDVTPLIVNAAMDPQTPDPLSIAAIELCVSVLGSEAGNLALKVLATGGVYVGGGIPPRILPFLGHDEFLAAFQRKGRLGELLARVPVHVIVENVALIGAASHGFETTA